MIFIVKIRVKSKIIIIIVKIRAIIKLIIFLEVEIDFF